MSTYSRKKITSSLDEIKDRFVLHELHVDLSNTGQIKFKKKKVLYKFCTTKLFFSVNFKNGQILFQSFLKDQLPSYENFTGLY